MPITVICPHCHTRLKCADQVAGQRIRCPSCRTPISIMTPTTAPQDDVSRPDLAVPHSGHRFRPGRKKSYPTALAGVLLFIGSAVLIAAYVVPWWGITAFERPKPFRKGYAPSDEEITAFNNLEQRIGNC